MATTPKINLPLIDSSMTADVPRDMNALANAIDAVVETTTGAKTKADQALASAKAYADAELNNARAVPLNFSYGTQVVDVGNTSLYELTGLKGRTLVNLLGRDGNCEDTGRWASWQADISAVTDNKTQGSKAIKFVSKVANSSSVLYKAAKDFSPKSGKLYIAIAMVKDVDSKTPVYINISENTINAHVRSKKTGEFELLYTTYSPKLDNVGNIEIFATSGSTAGVTVYVDAVRIYEITKAEYDAIPSMTADQVATKYPYVDSSQNVANPYVIGYGENLLPPFTEWYPTAQINMLPVSVYETTVNKTDSTSFAALGYTIIIPPNTDARFTVTRIANFTKSGVYGTYLNVYSVDSSGNQTAVTLADTSYNATSGIRDIYSVFRVPSDSVSIRVVIGVDSVSTGTFSFKNPMITIGNEAMQFIPRQDSILGLTTELASNVDGTVADEVFAKDGQYWKLVKHKSKEINGKTLTSILVGASATGRKTIVINDIAPGTMQNAAIFIKFDGKVLARDVYGMPATATDQFVIGVNGDVHVQVSNTDSGWGETYTPTADEIKQYFNGWKMYNSDTTTLANARSQGIYNGTGTKAWVTLVGEVKGAGLTSNLVYSDYIPYQLQYQLAQPTVEPVPHEGKLMLHKGANTVECGVGMEVREKASAGFINQWKINDQGNVASWLRYATNRIINVYRNAMKDSDWNIESNSLYGHGGGIVISKGNFDPSATYHVTYARLENNVPFVVINGEIAANLRGTVNDLVSETAALDTRLSVVERMKAEKDLKVNWIQSTLINAWINVAWAYPLSYYKDKDGWVTLRGMVAEGTSHVTSLPIGYRPARNADIPIATFNASTLVYGVSVVSINANGLVGTLAPSSLQSIIYVRFLAEQ